MIVVSILERATVVREPAEDGGWQDGPVDGSCLIFDFDGTILDTEEPSYRSWVELWARHGVELTLDEWQAHLGTNVGFDPLRELASRTGVSLDAGVAEERRARRDELQEHYALRPGVRKWLAEAQSLGVPIGIASSSSYTWVRGHLERLGIEAAFQCAVCLADDIPSKPDPTSYLVACAKLGADPWLSVAVEDSPHGVAAAVEAGLFTLAFPHGLTESLDFSSAALVVRSLDDLTLDVALTQARQRNGPVGTSTG
jgi:HAD superfamily hydrolase (TIGR01509 family)